MALALRAGAVLSDIEFVQFHPTVFFRDASPGSAGPAGAGVPRGPGAGARQDGPVSGDARDRTAASADTDAGVPRDDNRGQQPLITEAMRGEGAVLLDAHGERFMPAVHELADLAPRDVVAKAITRVMREQGVRHVWLDARGLGEELLLHRFPSIVARCRELGVDPVSEPIPVAPAAHYASGGVRTSLNGRTSISGLYACGEVACTGVHGANRLASNSLLEGLVYAGRIGADLARGLPPQADPVDDGRPAALLDPGIRIPLQDAMTRGAGVIRTAASLAGTASTVQALGGHTHGKPEPEAWEVTDLHTVAAALVHVAARRQETRGCHWREDFPERDDRRWRGHLRVTLTGDGTLTDTYEAI
jgi:L-aspartate oxidase